MSVTVQNMLDFVTNLQQRIDALEVTLREQETLSVYYAQTLRDQFAMAVLDTICTDNGHGLRTKPEYDFKLIARLCYECADQMLAERAKGEK